MVFVSSCQTVALQLTRQPLNFGEINKFSQLGLLNGDPVFFIEVKFTVNEETNFCWQFHNCPLNREWQLNICSPTAAASPIATEKL